MFFLSFFFVFLCRGWKDRATLGSDSSSRHTDEQKKNGGNHLECCSRFLYDTRLPCIRCAAGSFPVFIRFIPVSFPFRSRFVPDFVPLRCRLYHSTFFFALKIAILGRWWCVFLNGE